MTANKIRRAATIVLLLLALAAPVSACAKPEGAYSKLINPSEIWQTVKSVGRVVWYFGMVPLICAFPYSPCPRRAHNQGLVSPGQRSIRVQAARAACQNRLPLVKAKIS